ncbi:MAG: bifunctional folylpolyglutamate synthase/dihydrofolate synthase [Cytophagaceae bacterium]
MNYQETLEYLYNSLPMFHRIGPAAFKSSLDNIIKLCAALENPHYKFKSVHVGGTNGKGSSSHMLAAILQSAGYKTGLYTSPHLKSFRERIRINGIKISEEEVTDFVSRNIQHFEEIKPSFFEMTCAMAFEHFARNEVDFAVVEVGLGGRLDSTNIILPEVCLITNISLDHQNLLGETLEQIAIEKAGIIKSNVPAVVSEFQEEVFDVFIDKALEKNSPLGFAPFKFRIEDWKIENGKLKLNIFDHNGKRYYGLPCQLIGSYQLKNIPGVLMVINVLRGKNFLIPDEAIIEGLDRVVELTGLKGRWQTLQEKPLVICDTAHNEAGIENVVQQIRHTPHKKLHFIFGTVSDKDTDKILDLLPKEAHYYFCQANIPRALDAKTLAAAAQKFSLKGTVIADVNEALRTALSKASPDDLIFIGGSNFVVAEIEGL